MSADDANVATIPAGSVIITPTRMYDEMRKIGEKVDHLSSVVDPALDEIRRDVTALDKKHTELVGRVRILEHWRWFILGIAAGVGVAGGYGASLLMGGG